MTPFFRIINLSNVNGARRTKDMQLTRIETIKETKHEYGEMERRQDATLAGASQIVAGQARASHNQGKETDGTCMAAATTTLRKPKMASLLAMWHVGCGIVLSLTQLVYSAIRRKNDRGRLRFLASLFTDLYFFVGFF